MILLETISRNLTHPPASTHVDYLDAEGITLSANKLARRGRLVTVWTLGVSPEASRSTLRYLRIHLCRLHAEREAFRELLRRISRGDIPITRGSPESEVLQSYLNRISRLFFEERRYSVGQAAILKAAYLHDELVSSGERAALQAQLEGIRGNIKRKLDAIIEHDSQPAERPLTIYYNYTLQEGSTMSEQHVHLGNVGGSITGSFNVDSQINDSFNAIQRMEGQDEIKQRLTELTAAVAQLAKALPEDQAQTAARDLKSFTEEIASPTPRKHILQVLAEGLSKTAETVKEVGPTVLSLTTAIIGLVA